jgi:ABC-2 type transport system ATP-binding protein
MTDKMPVISIKNLVKSFGNFQAIKDISFELERGEILGLLGPNGAGKTTTIQILLGLTTPTSGTVTVLGKDIKAHHEEILYKINFSSAYISLPEKLTVYENLLVFATLYGIKNSKTKINDLMETFQIQNLRNKPTGELSAGQKTRVSFAKSLLNDPEILLLDEPMASLDPEAADRSKNLLRQIQKERHLSILFTSHNMDEVEELCSRIIFLHHGTIVASGTPHQVTSKVLKISAKEPDLEKVFITLAREGEEDYEAA